MATDTPTQADTQAESEAFDAIVREAHNLLARMDEVKQRFDNVRRRIEMAGGAVTQSRGVLSTAVQGLQSAIHQTTTQMAALIGFCATEHQDIFVRLEDWTQLTGSAIAQLEKTANQALGAVDQSQQVAQTVFDQVAQTSRSFIESAKAQVSNLQVHVTELGEQFHAKAQPAMASFDEFLGSMIDQSDAYSHQVHGQVTQLQQQLETFVEAELLAPLTEHSAHANRFLADLGQVDVAGAVNLLMETGREALEEGVKGAIREVTDVVGDGIDAVIDALNEAGTDNELVREALEPVIEMVRSAIAPVEETIGNVRSIAAVVGASVN